MIKKYACLILIILFSCSIFLWNEIDKGANNDSLSVNFLDVGQGDAALVQKGNFQILIDGGPDDSVLPEISKIMPPFDRKIELVVLTHPHADHLVGINKILDRYEIGEIESAGVVASSSLYLEFLEKIKEKKISLSVPGLGSKKDFAENSSIYFLWPGDKYINRQIDNLNNSSLVSKVCYFSNCVLFMGDQEKDEQQKMVDYYKDIKSEDLFKGQIIKAAHHGSSNGLFPDLYQLSGAKSAIISAGKDNQFGHPHPVVLDYLIKNSISTYRTDQRGTIWFNLEPKNIVLK
jgi:competence protein ComEC